MVDAVLFNKFLGDFIRKRGLASLLAGEDIISDEERTYVERVIRSQLTNFLSTHITPVLRESVLDMNEELETDWDVCLENLKKAYSCDALAKVDPEYQASYNFLFCDSEVYNVRLTAAERLSRREFNVCLDLITTGLFTQDELETWWNLQGFDVDRLRSHISERVVFGGRLSELLKNYTATKLTLKSSAIQQVATEYIAYMISGGKEYVEKLLKSEGSYKATEVIEVPSFAKVVEETRSEEEDPDEPGTTILNVVYKPHSYWMHKNVFTYLHALAEAVKAKEDINWLSVATHIGFYYKRNSRDRLFCILLTRCMLRMFHVDVPQGYDFVTFIKSADGQAALQKGAGSLDVSAGSVHMAMLEALSVANSTMDVEASFARFDKLMVDGMIVSGVVELAYMLGHRRLLGRLLSEGHKVSNDLLPEVFKYVIEAGDFAEGLTGLLKAHPDVFAYTLGYHFGSPITLCDMFIQRSGYDKVLAVLKFVADQDPRPNLTIGSRTFSRFIQQAISELDDRAYLDRAAYAENVKELIELCQKLDLFKFEEFPDEVNVELIRFIMHCADLSSNFFDVCYDSGLLDKMSDYFSHQSGTCTSLLEFTIASHVYGVSGRLVDRGYYVGYNGPTDAFVRLCIKEQADGSVEVNENALLALHNQHHNILCPAIEVTGYARSFGLLTLAEYAMLPGEFPDQPSDLLKFIIRTVGVDQLGAVPARGGGDAVPPIYFAFREGNNSAVRYLASQGVIPARPITPIDMDDEGAALKDHALYAFYHIAHAIVEHMHSSKGRFNRLDTDRMGEVERAVFCTLFDHYASAANVMEALSADFGFKYNQGDQSIAVSTDIVTDMARTLLGEGGSERESIGCCGLRQRITPVLLRVSSCVQNNLSTRSIATTQELGAPVHADLLRGG